MLPRVGRDDRAVATARLKLQLSAPDVEAALASLPASARRDAGVMLRPAPLAARSGQRGRRTRDPAQSAGGAWPPGAVVARAGEGDPRRDRRRTSSSWLIASPAPAGRARAPATPTPNGSPAGWRSSSRASPRPRGATSSVSGRRSRRRSAEVVRATGPDAPPRRTATRRPRAPGTTELPPIRAASTVSSPPASSGARPVASCLR